MKLFPILFLLVFIYSYTCQENKVNIDAFPWMVSIQFTYFGKVQHVCGGALASDIFVLTAASCFDGMLKFFDLFSIHAGINSVYNENEAAEQIRSVSQIIVHPNYNNPDEFLNNLALVRVSPAFNIKSLSVSTILLSNLTSLENMDLITIGWNLMANQSNSSMPIIHLQQITVREDVQCTNNELLDSEIQLCAIGTCQNDSGGPLMVYSNDTQQYKLVGITSFCNVCISEGLFTRTAPFFDWISGILDNPPALTTLATRLPITIPTPKPDVHGPPILFTCNPSYSCGCSSTSVIFHDEPPFSHDNDFVQARIMGGENAQPHSWPWIVSLRRLNEHFCGGSLLNREWVLTTAHCMLNINELTVHIGVHNQTSFGPQARGIVQVIIHPDYEPPPRYVNDIALFRLSSPVDFTIRENYAGSACLPPKTVKSDYPTVGTRLSVIGWGRLLHNGPPAEVLRQVRVKRIADDDERCLTTIIDKNRQFCAMVDGGEKDSCQGDSGGPIHQWDGDHWTQVGIVSFGKRCGEADYPGIYTRLSVYHEWFVSNQNETGPIIFGVQCITGDSADACGAANIIEMNLFFVFIFFIHHFYLSVSIK